MRSGRWVLVLAALYGAAGVSLLAAGSHAAPGNATVAGQMLLFHAPVLMAACLAVETSVLYRTAGFAATAIMALSVGVFSVDLGLRGFGYGRLFAMAAPIGGSLTILGWIVLLAAAAFGNPSKPE